MKNTKAIVTLTLGKKYVQEWKKFCQKNWHQYAEKHGYDIICIEHPLDYSERAKKRTPSWQKCLILSQEFSQNYEKIVWVDSDILMNWHKAPCIVKNVAVEKVGAVLSGEGANEQLSTEAKSRLFNYWGMNDEKTARNTYIKYGFPGDFDRIIQCGVLVLSPQHHRHILEEVYYQNENKGYGEMAALSYRLLKSDLVEWIDYRFNFTWAIQKALYYPFLIPPLTPKITYRIKRKIASFLPFLFNQKLIDCVNTAYINSFFLHFAGGTSDMKFVNTNLTTWQDLLKS